MLPDASTADLRNTYEAVIYESRAIPYAHPERIAAVAARFGLTTQPVQRARILELGCATGGNLLAIAAAYPESRCVGIDLSPAQIASGRHVVDALALSNVELRAGDITEIDESWGTFDYILCHGVYSWVPAPVQQAILQICSRNLADTGIAYVSYNCYPGWSTRGAARSMIRLHDRPELEPAARKARAVDLLETIANNVVPRDSLYARQLDEEIANVRGQTLFHFLHEQLEIYNQPFFFTEFMAAAHAANLDFVADAEQSATRLVVASDFLEHVGQWSGNRIEREQYMDFLKNRTFARTLLCHAHRPVVADPIPESLRALFFRAQASPIESSDTPRGARAFEGADHLVATIGDALAISILDALFDVAPGILSFSELATAVASHAPAFDETRFLEVLDSLASARLVGVHSVQIPVASEPRSHPRARAFARWQARGSEPVTNLLHVPVNLDPGERLILDRCDGSRDCETIIAESTLLLHQLGAAPGGNAPDLTTSVRGALDYLAQRAFFVQ